ncbi:MAG: hypothetical protein BroJett012_07100 [Betaproteobacteria bacterium]|nr:MAG: hypothetical protein BroJett012_07100 [Betaproteobacteria bacterium]
MFTFKKKLVAPGADLPASLPWVGGGERAASDMNVPSLLDEMRVALASETAMRLELQIALKTIDPGHPLVSPGRRDTPEWKWATVGRFEEVMDVFRRENGNQQFHDYIDAVTVRDPVLNSRERNAAAQVLAGLLPIYDILMAMTLDPSLDAAHREAITDSLQQCEKVFSAAGAVEVGLKGEKFDPLLHESVLQVPAADEQGRGVVAEVRRPGLQVGVRLLRPALVVVSV